MPDKPRRLQTPTEREIESAAARKERGNGVPADFTNEECTGKYQGPDLAERRAKRPTDERIAHLEQKHDALADIVHETHGDVREMKGQLQVLPELVDEIRTTAKEARERQNQHDAEAADVRKHRRERWTLVGKSLAGGGALIEVLHRMGWL